MHLVVESDQLFKHLRTENSDCLMLNLMHESMGSCKYNKQFLNIDYNIL